MRRGERWGSLEKQFGSSGEKSLVAKESRIDCEGLSVSSISRRVKAAARAAGLGAGYSGHSGRVGMARRMARAGAPTHEIMAQGCWRSAGMVADYTRAEHAEWATRWLG